MNFFLLFEATDIYSGEFVFTIWYKGIPGRGEAQPTTPDLTDFVPIIDIPEPDPEPVVVPEAVINTDKQEEE
jgi:hypothetical protein